jgi:soluble lytic murein transglycosylase-like protein
MTRPSRALLRAIALVGCLGTATSARAELVFFTSGRSMSVKSHRVDGESLVIALRGGGEASFDRSLVTKIEPDEVPYPEPESALADTIKPDTTTDSAGAAYGEIIDQVSAAHGVDARLVKALIQVESAYKPRATSRKGAMGLMQLMPETARQYAVRDPYDVRANIEAGISHLKVLLDRFPRPLALAAYNAGVAAVERFGGVPPYAETRDYVARILSIVGR